MPVQPAQRKIDAELQFSDHTARDSAVCGRPHTTDRTDVESNLVYKWVDKAGQTHMSDTAPDGYLATVFDMSGAKRDFTYEISADGFTLPSNFQGQIYAGSKRIYDTWHFFLGERSLRQSRIKLRLFDGKEKYDAFRKVAWPGSKPSNGFYSPGRNEAYVKFDQRNPVRAVRTSFHEISHLITASHLGVTPPWLTEGLAEYFEMLELNTLTGAVDLNHAHLRLLQQQGRPSLKQLLLTNRAMWHGEQRDLNYAAAWSLVHFLLQGAPGMYALKDVIQGFHSHFCQPFPALNALDSAYPGGLSRLESDWGRWLSQRTG